MLYRIISGKREGEMSNMDHDVLVDNAAYGASQKQISLTSSSEKAVSRKQLLDVASTLTDFVSLFGTATAATVFQRRIRPRKVRER